MQKKVIIIIVILTSIQFYQLSFIPEAVIKTSELLGIALMAAVIVLYTIYSREKLFKAHFTTPIVLIIVSVLISMFGAYAFHDQSFLITAWAQRSIYFYLVYLLLHVMKVPGEFIIRCILSFALLYAGLYLLQYFIYPIELTHAKVLIDRGTIRIMMPGLGYLVVGYFIWLYLTFRRKKMKYILFLLLSMTIFVLLGTRQVLAVIVLLTLLFILLSKMVKSKVLVFLLIGAAFIPVFFIFQDIILSMLEVTQKQGQTIEKNIRLEAARFFLTDFYPSGWAYITGNGTSGASLYGLRIFRYAKEFGYYQSDIGLIGEYTKYGFLYVLGVIIILYRVLIKKIPEKLMFIKYNFTAIILTLVTGGGVFGTAQGIVTNCMLLYLIDLYLNDAESFKNYPVKSVS
jgi:hypothetical protein